MNTDVFVVDVCGVAESDGCEKERPAGVE